MPAINSLLLVLLLLPPLPPTVLQAVVQVPVPDVLQLHAARQGRQAERLFPHQGEHGVSLPRDGGIMLHHKWPNSVVAASPAWPKKQPAPDSCLSPFPVQKT